MRDLQVEVVTSLCIIVFLLSYSVQLFPELQSQHQIQPRIQTLSVVTER